MKDGTGMELRAGQRVLIRGADTWSVGRIEEIRTPGQLPAIAGAPSPADVAEVLAEGGVTRVAVISYGDMIFAALETEAGWHDLRKQPLQLAATRHNGFMRSISRARAAAAARAMREHVEELVLCIETLERYAGAREEVHELVPRDRLRDLIGRGEALERLRERLVALGEPRPAA